VLISTQLRKRNIFEVDKLRVVCGEFRNQGQNPFPHLFIIDDTEILNKLKAFVCVGVTKILNLEHGNTSEMERHHQIMVPNLAFPLQSQMLPASASAP
jgi:hypothetical protein